LLRNLEEARKTADAAMAAAGGFFDSAYGNRDTSPALVNEGVRHAINIAHRISRAEEKNKAVDFATLDAAAPVYGLSGIEFLLMMVPAIGAALACAAPNSTVGMTAEHVTRLDALMKDSRLRGYLWINRKNALSSHAGVALTISVKAPALSRCQVEAWLKGEYAPLASITARGLVAGLRKCHGLLGLAVSPTADQFRLVLGLPS
jgi:hypothetical protein